MGELEANHDIMKQELEISHTEELQCVKQQYEVALEGTTTTLLSQITCKHSLKLLFEFI